MQSLKLPPSQSAIVPVKLENAPWQFDEALMVEGEVSTAVDSGVLMEDAVISVSEDGIAQLVITNLSGITQKIPEGTFLGTAQLIDVVAPSSELIDVKEDMSTVKKITSQEEWRREKLLQMVQLDGAPQSEVSRLRDFIADNHDVFSLEEGERGETDLVTMSIDTGDTHPQKQAPQRMPFVLRQEVAEQLKDMQRNGVIQPSCSPWSSPVVMVRKKDGSHRFCVDYRGLNAVTRADTFPLPRIDDLLDQLGGARYFSTLDLASEFWQIRVEPES